MPGTNHASSDPEHHADPAANGAILRCNPNGTGLECVAWGLRNPYGIAIHPDGRLFATEQGIDKRGERYIFGRPPGLLRATRALVRLARLRVRIRVDDPR